MARERGEERVDNVTLMEIMNSENGIGGFKSKLEYHLQEDARYHKKLQRIFKAIDIGAEMGLENGFFLDFEGVNGKKQSQVAKVLRILNLMVEGTILERSWHFPVYGVCSVVQPFYIIYICKYIDR